MKKIQLEEICIEPLDPPNCLCTAFCTVHKTQLTSLKLLITLIISIDVKHCEKECLCCTFEAIKQYGNVSDNWESAKRFCIILNDK